MKKEESNTQELNLLDLIILFGRWIKSFFKSLTKCTGKTLQLLYRHKFIFFSIVLIGIAGSFYTSRKSNRIYKVDGMIKLCGIKSHNLLKIGKQLSFDASNLDKRDISKKLKLSDSIVNKIQSIEFFPVIDYNKDSIPNVVDFKRKHPLDDTVNVVMDNHIFIRLKLRKNTTNGDKIGKSILNFINKQPTIQTSFLAYKKSLKERLDLCDIEIKRLDSLANKKYFEEPKRQIEFKYNQLLVGNNYTQLFYEHQLILQKVKSNINEELVNAVAPLIAPSGFIVDPHPVNGRLKTLFAGFLISLIISILISYIIENRKKWIEFLNKK